jgi:hypothetical protein
MKKKIRSKFLSAVLMSLLVVSGGFLAMPMLGASQNMQPGNLNFTSQNPQKFLQTENLGLRDDFKYSENSFGSSAYFGGNNFSVNEGALNSAIEEGNYDAWKDAQSEENGFSSVDNFISEEEFNVLVALRKSKISEESE